MKQYKAAAVMPGPQGILDVWTSGGVRVPLDIPHRYQSLLKPGTRIRVYRNADHVPVAYSLGWDLFFPVPPTTDAEIASVIGQLCDIYHNSLDSLMFKYSLGRTLRNLGMVPTGRPETDLKMYALHYGVYKQR